jgi:hypothetical protein
MTALHPRTASNGSSAGAARRIGAPEGVDRRGQLVVCRSVPVSHDAGTGSGRSHAAHVNDL